jgi:hyperosmotically inducible protein
MKIMPLFYAVALIGISLLCGCNKGESNATSSTAATQPDNTAMNKVDRNSATTTPVDQGENSADVKITAEIRRAIMDDKSLSTNAQNAKIVTNKGAVTLRGVVASSGEKDSVETKAKSVAGVTSVDNQLEIKNP